MSFKKLFIILLFTIVALFLILFLYGQYIDYKANSAFDKLNQNHKSILDSLVVPYQSPEMSEEDQRRIQVVQYDNSAFDYKRENRYGTGSDVYSGFCDSDKFAALQDSLGVAVSCADAEERFIYSVPLESGFYFCKDLYHEAMIKDETKTFLCADAEFTDQAKTHEVAVLKDNMDVIAERQRNGTNPGWSSSFADSCEGVFVENRQRTYEKIGLQCEATDTEYKISVPILDGYYCVSSDGYEGFAKSDTDYLSCE